MKTAHREQCDGCLGIGWPPGTFKGISFQISRSHFETFDLCNSCSDAIIQEAKKKVYGKKISNAQANYAVGKIAYDFTGNRRGRDLGFDTYATWTPGTWTPDVEQKQIKQGEKMSLILFKEGDHMGIQTDCATENEFRYAFCDALDEMIEAKKYDGDWNLQLQGWLLQFADMICAYRGYKNEVRKSVVMSVGNTNPQDAAYKALAGEQNKPVLEGFLKHINGEAKDQLTED